MAVAAAHARCASRRPFRPRTVVHPFLAGMQARDSRAMPIQSSHRRALRRQLSHSRSKDRGQRTSQGLGRYQSGVLRWPSPPPPEPSGRPGDLSAGEERPPQVRVPFHHHHALLVRFGHRHVLLVRGHVQSHLRRRNRGPPWQHKHKQRQGLRRLSTQLKRLRDAYYQGIWRRFRRTR